MDVYGLKQYIINDPKLIEVVLEKAGFHNIRDNKLKNEYRAARDEGRNPTSVRVKKDTLASTCFSTNLKGDLLTLVQGKLGISFPKTIEFIANTVKFEDDFEFDKYIVPFGGFYKKITKLKKEEYIDLETYSDDVLERFERIPNMLFFKDGISPSIQNKFNIGYDSLTSRISVPWYSFDGRICGIMGRLNKKEVSDDEVKWYPIISFPKSKTLYGFVHNYSQISEKGICMIGESEKFSLQLASKGLNVGLSLGGSFMSEIQANHIKSLFPKKILIMLDEGLEEDHSVEIVNKLKINKFYKNKVGYVFDRNNLYLPKGSKMSPSDLDKKTLHKLITNCTVWT